MYGRVWWFCQSWSRTRLRCIESLLLKVYIFFLLRPANMLIHTVLILSHATTIKTKYQAMLHVGPVSQTCVIIDIDRTFIRTGDRALVAFRFVQRPEYLAPGDRLLFREGRTKGLGIVKSVGYDPTKPLSAGFVSDEKDDKIVKLEGKQLEHKEAKTVAGAS